MLLIIDNYDSFTYNLVQYFGELGADPVVYEHDKISLEKIHSLAPEKLCISPGPGSPSDAGISNAAIKNFAGIFPILGVCLGHQCIAEVFGGKIRRAERLMHGKTSPIFHNGKDLFNGLLNPFEATRYHSLIVNRETFPDCLEITAETVEKEIMGLKHRELPIWGIQFHPESILTEHGKELLNNFLQL
ncbi:MAG: anthranilate synthase component II [Chthoniobacterales bacterium]